MAAESHTQPTSRAVMVMTGPKILALVFGVLGVLVGATLLAGATTILTEDRDEDGFFVSDEHTFERSSHAILSEDVDILTDAPSWVIDRLTDPVDLRIQGTDAGGAGLFIGIAATADVETYLSGVAHDEVTSLDIDDGSIANVEYVIHEGTQFPTTPGLKHSGTLQPMAEVSRRSIGRSNPETGLWSS